MKNASPLFGRHLCACAHRPCPFYPAWPTRRVQQIHAKVKGKLEELVLEKYELRMRLRELERNHVDPAELQALRRQARPS